MMLTDIWAMAQRAFEIADTQMFIALRSYGLDKEGTGRVFSLVRDGQVVHRIEDAAPELREAVEWLQSRDYVELITDDAGQFVGVLRLPGEA